jgi:hypothetical protein
VEGKGPFIYKANVSLLTSLVEGMGPVIYYNLVTRSYILFLKHFLLSTLKEPCLLFSLLEKLGGGYGKAFQ